MRLIRMVLVGYGPYKNRVEVQLTDGAYYLLGRNHDEPSMPSNGSGKTRFISAIAWCLFGRTHNGAKKDMLINRDSKEVLVELGFDTGLVVRRAKKRGQSEDLWFHDGTKEYAGDLDPNQTELIKIIGITPTLFFNAIWISRESKSVQFLYAEPSKRLEILEEIMADSKYANARTAASRKVETLTTEYRATTARHAQMKVQEEDLKRRLLSTQQQYQDAAEQVSTQQQRNASRIVEIRKELSSLTVGQTQDGVGLDELSEQVRVQNTGIAALNQQIGAVRAKATMHITDTCPTCLRPFETGNVTQAHQQKTQAEQELQRLNGLKEQADNHLQKIQLEIQIKRTAVSLVVANSSRESALQRDLQALQDDRSDSILTGFKQTIIEAQQSIHGLQANMLAHEKDMHRLQAAIPDYQVFEKAFSSKGIRTLLMDDLRTMMQHHVSYYCQELSNGQIHIDFPHSNSGFEVTIYINGHETPREVASTGELWRANLCVLLALRDVLQFTNTTQLRMLFLDDACGTLDEGGEIAVIEVAQKLADKFGLVFVTLPKDHARIPRESVILIEKRGEVSEILTEVA